MTDPDVAPAAPSAKFAIWDAIVSSTIILSGYIAVAVLIFFVEIPTKSETAALLIFGGLNTLASLAAGFWLGSSVGSMQKNARPRAG